MGSLVSDQGRKSIMCRRHSMCRSLQEGKGERCGWGSGARREMHRLRLGGRQGPDHSGPHRPQQGVWTSEYSWKGASEAKQCIVKNCDKKDYSGCCVEN